MRPSAVIITLSLGFTGAAFATNDATPAATPAKAKSPNLLLKTYPKGFDGMGAANRKIALQCAQNLMKGFKLLGSSGLSDRETLDSFIKEIDADIAPLKSGNDADKAAHSGAQTVMNALRYAGDASRTEKWNDAAMNTLLRLPSGYRYGGDPSVLSNGIGLLLIDYLRLVMGGEHKEADLTPKRPAA